ncbi:MAG: ribosomal L7Ae/L30e/S12e/Gadd45 family protein [Candidatus Pacearchaeota archaeon]
MKKEEKQGEQEQEQKEQKEGRMRKERKEEGKIENRKTKDARNETNKEKMKEMKEKKVIFGSRVAIKLIKKDPKAIKLITLARDLEKNLKEKIIELAKAAKIEIVESSKTKKELAEQFKKPFTIGCLTQLK